MMRNIRNGIIIVCALLTIIFSCMTMYEQHQFQKETQRAYEAMCARHSPEWCK